MALVDFLGELGDQRFAYPRPVRDRGYVFTQGHVRSGAEGGTRTPTGCPIRPSNVRVYQFHHFGILARLDLKSRCALSNEILVLLVGRLI